MNFSNNLTLNTKHNTTKTKRGANLPPRRGKRMTGINTIAAALIANSTMLYLRVTLGIDGDFKEQWCRLSPKEQDALREDARTEMKQPHNVRERKRLVELKCK